MAACATTYATTYFESGRGLSSRIAERNAELMAQQALKRRRVRTPEFHFTHAFDNSRLVKAPDTVRTRQMRVFSAAVAVLFSLVMIYGLQHFYSIESGYRVESDKVVLEQLREQNKQLRLKEAKLTQPARIDRLAHQRGLAAPQPGQVVHPDPRLDPGTPQGTPALAQIHPPAQPAQ